MYRLSRTWRGLLALAALCLPHLAQALSFAPTESEWSTWPAYCQARYVVSGAGRDSDYATRVDAATVNTWETRLGSEVWFSLHHYCAGLIIVNRAKATNDKHERELLLKSAIGEYHFSLNNTPSTYPMYAEIAARKGLVHGELGEDELAVKHFDIAIAACPQCSIGYSAKATYFRSHKRLEDARAALEQGNRALEQKSPELHYALGLLLVDLKEYELAQEHARQAYESGYPLPGLRERLARAGHPLD